MSDEFDWKTIAIIGVGAYLLFKTSPVIKSADRTIGAASNIASSSLNAVSYILEGPKYPANETYSKPNLFDFKSWAVNQPGYLKGFLQ